jgi:UDP-3-O-[3-hydroxymyristoyl] glucosamine N-acyltransferase
MRVTLAEIARLVGGEVSGDGATLITGVAGIKEAQPGDITFLANPKYLPLLEQTQASAVIIGRDVEATSRRPVVRADNPSLAFTKVITQCIPEEVYHWVGVHPSAVVGKGVTLGKDVSIGPCAVVADHASIGDKTVVYAGCYIGAYSRVGSGCLIYPNVSIREKVTVGDRVIIHSGAVLGSDGFGFVTVDGVHTKIPQVGTVEIGDDVEIGANVTIDRARFDKTVIGKGTKIDNLVHLAHNVVVGEHCLLVAQVGVSGSTEIGNRATLAGQVGVAGHLTIGEGAIVGAKAGVTKSVPAGIFVSGYPAKPHDKAQKVNACVQNLPRLMENVKSMAQRIEALEAQLKELKR